MKQVCVVGGGPAGMMAAWAAAENGCRVHLYEKNEKLGKKLYITGKGRCNLTNAAPIEDFFDQIVSNKHFLYSAFYTFDNAGLIDWMARYGLKTKTERGGRVFPVSDKASDVIKTLEKALDDAGVTVLRDTGVQSVQIENGRCTGIVADGQFVAYDHVIVATGGVSYASTGSTGDGYQFAKAVGHAVVAPEASLVGIDTQEDVHDMAGLSLKNIGLSLETQKGCIYADRGEMLFTHTGISGPLVLSASAFMHGAGPYRIIIDLKPALDNKTLDNRLLRDITEKSNMDLLNMLRGLLPSKMIPYIIAQTGIDAHKKAHSITKEERAALVRYLKTLEFGALSKRPIAEAVITQGGVDVKEVDASTLRSKKCEGLSFAGEVLDVDALTGGYNLQIAFSTGYLAGMNC